MEKVEITIEKIDQTGYVMRITQGDAINRKLLLDDEYEVGERITSFLVEQDEKN